MPPSRSSLPSPATELERNWNADQFIASCDPNASARNAHVNLAVEGAIRSGLVWYYPDKGSIGLTKKGFDAGTTLTLGN